MQDLYTYLNEAKFLQFFQDNAMGIEQIVGLGHFKFNLKKLRN